MQLVGRIELIEQLCVGSFQTGEVGEIATEHKGQRVKVSPELLRLHACPPEFPEKPGVGDDHPASIR